MTALLTDNLPLLAGAPNGIKKLRELILELAVRGKLVPQDPNDEPASELLKRIAEEKARLVAETRGKKQKAFAEVSAEENPYMLPSGWECTRLGDLVDPRRTITYGVLKPGGDTTDGVPLIKTENVQFNLILTAFKSRISAELDEEYKRTRLQGGEVLLTLVGSIGRCAIAPIELAGANLSRSVGMIVPVNGVDKRFMVYAMTALINESFILKKCAGTAQKVLNVGTVNDMPYPLPPIAEQHRIVAKVDELMALCDRLEAQQADADSAHTQLVQALLNSLTQASDADDFAQSWQRLAEHFHTLFTTESSIDALKQTLLQLAVMGKLVQQDPSDEPADELIGKIAKEVTQLYSEGKIRKPKSVIPVSKEEARFESPQGWRWLRLSQITRQLGDGLHGTPIYSQDGAHHFVNGNNLKNGKIVIKPETKTVSESEYSKHKKPLDKQSILVSINGTIGNVAFYNSEKVVLGKSACYLNLAGGVSKHFVRLLIEAPSFMEYALKSATGSTIKNLGLKAMNDYPIALPPLAEQHRIVAKVDQLMALCDQLKTRLAQARQIREQLASTLVEQAVT